MSDDPTRVRNQPALTTSTGRSWLILGALFIGVSFLVLVPMTSLTPAGVAWTAIIADLVLYVVMVLARLVIPGGRLRLGVMACAMLAIAAISLTAATIVAGSA